jgi:general nucleoside transport system ATP-binding protein
MSAPLFELQHITKYFSKVIANSDVSFSIQEGEILSLLGENGAGKSTCMKILYGLYHPDSGTICQNGVPVSIHSPRDAMSLGISMIQQHFSLVQAATVTENIILGKVSGIINWHKKEQEIVSLAEKFGFSVDPKACIKDLSAGEQQKVEILKALYRETSLLIMDEPTAILTPREIENLMQFSKNYAAKGNSIIFITHKMKEVLEISDRIVIMRDGRVYGDILRRDADETKLASMMFGHKIDSLPIPDKKSVQDSIILRVENLTVKRKNEPVRLNNISFEIHAGEILGFAGVSGNGQQELCMSLCGAESSSGNIFLNGNDISNFSIRERIESGIGYVPSDRFRYGMIMNMSLSENIFLKSSYNCELSRFGIIDFRKLHQKTAELIASFNVKATGPQAKAGELSGGNQQKILVGRETSGNKDLVIFDQPSRGLDLDAIQHVHKTILQEKQNGKAVLLISTELSEIFTLSDRIAVLYKGAIQCICTPEELDTASIGLLMAGYK